VSARLHDDDRVDRHDCFTTCNSNSGGNTTPASYTSGVGACAHVVVQHDLRVL